MSNRRFEMYEYRQVLHRMRRGTSDRKIARLGLMGRSKAKAVREVARTLGWLDPSCPLPGDEALAQEFSLETRSSPASSVEPYRERVEAWYQEGLQATTIFSALVRLYSFRGSYSAVRRFVKRLEGAPSNVTVPLRFSAGDAAQVDFGRGPDLGEQRTWVFVMTLCHSRHQYAEVILDQKVETWLSCHIHAFEFFDGVPRRVIIDNPKCAITKACRFDPEVQRSYNELAEGYGFLIDPCPPREPQLKGRVESGVKYLKRSFVPLRDFRDRTDANQQVIAWILGEAGNRIHGTTRKRPLVVFEETEKALLQPLPPRRVEPSTWVKVKVPRDGHVQFELCRYSVPYTQVGQSLWLRATPSMISVFLDHKLVATHSRLFTPGEISTVDDHLCPSARLYLEQTPEWCLAQAREIGPSCTKLVQLLQGDKVLERHRAVQNLVRLRKSYGDLRLEAACRRALRFSNHQYRAVKTILARGLEALEDEVQAFDSLADVYRGSSRFSRDIKTLLTN